VFGQPGNDQVKFALFVNVAKLVSVIDGLDKREIVIFWHVSRKIEGLDHLLGRCLVDSLVLFEVFLDGFPAQFQGVLEFLGLPISDAVNQTWV